MTRAPFDAFDVPPAAFGPAANEVLRAAVVDGGLQVSIRPAFDDPEVWGIMLADIARHAARMFASENKTTEDAALRAICDMFNAEMDDPTDPGTTERVS
jgi:hypothetical protein